MKALSRLMVLLSATTVLAILSACGGGGGGSRTPTPPPPPPLSITTTRLPDGVVGKQYSAKAEATGGNGTRTWSITNGPSWLTINSATGELSGTVNDQWAGYVYLQVKDTVPNSVTAVFWLNMYPVLEVVAPPGGTLGLEYSGYISTRGGNQPPNKLSISGSLPPGLSADFDNYGHGTLAGTPTQAGSFTFTVNATDRADPPQSIKAEVTMVIDTHLAITTKQLKYAVEGRSYSDFPTAINGTPPYTWSAEWLPHGLSINATSGEISGTPTTGSSTVPLTVTDSSNPPQTATRAVSLMVYGKLAFSISNPVITANAGSFWGQISTWGGVPPLSYTLTSGQLPTGLSMNQSGYISGTVEKGDYEFSVTVQDSASPPQVLERPFALHILPPALSADWSKNVLARAGKPVSHELRASAGTPPYSWKVIGLLPAGLTLSDSGLLSGTALEDGYFTFNAEVSDSATPVQKARTSVELRVLPFAPVPNNSVANATPIQFEALALSISPYTDENGVAAPDTDYFRFLAQGGSTVNVYTSGSFGSSADTVLELLDQNGVRLTTCNNPADDNPASYIVRDLTPYGFDDDCVNDDGYTSGVNSRLDLKVPGNSDTIHTIYAHVVEYTGNARPEFEYSVGVSSSLEPLRVRDTFAPIGVVDGYYAWYPSFMGGLGSRTLGLGAGSTLPAGLSINGSGITGRPTTSGQYSFTLQGMDSANPPEIVERTYEVTVVPKLKVNLAELPQAKLGVPYDAQIAVSGGGQTLKYRLSPSSWPCCLYMREDGHIVGTPKESGTYNAWIEVSDETGQWTNKYFTLTVTDGTLQVRTSALPEATAGSPTAGLQTDGGHN
ncbi:MAG TPA: Ig domain-containing protein [Terriglobales bacterium]|nr:Ig domain-containing protein [Terriglobales bacterium]